MPKPNNDWNTTKRRLHNYQDHTGDWEADFEDLDLDLPSGRKAWYAGLNVKTLLASILICSLLVNVYQYSANSSITPCEQAATESVEQSQVKPKAPTQNHSLLEGKSMITSEGPLKKEEARRLTVDRANYLSLPPEKPPLNRQSESDKEMTPSAKSGKLLQITQTENFGVTPSNDQNKNSFESENITARRKDLTSEKITSSMVGSESNSTLGAGIVKQDVVDSKNSRAHEAQPDQNTTYHQGGESSVIRKHQPVNLLRHFDGAHTEVTSAYPINQYVRKSRYPVLNQLSSGNSEGFGIKVRRTKIKIFNTPIDSVSLGLSVGTRFSFGHRYRVGASPVITSYARLRWFLTNDDGDFELGRRYHENDENYQDDSPVGVEMGFFQPKASYLNQNDILYRTEQPANLIFEGAPEDARLAYDIAGAWGLELGLTDRSRILKWLSIDTRIGLSYHNYKQTIQQVTGSTQLALEGAPNLVNRFGFYWGVAPECRIARKLRFHVGYHGLIGSKPKKKFFPGANNGLEGIEVGLNYGF